LDSHSGGADENDAKDGRLVVAFGGNNTSGTIDVATARSAHSGPHGRLDFETETFLVQAVAGNHVTHALNTANNGKHCSEDGTGRGVPIIAFSAKDYGADAGDVSPTLRAMNFSKSHANAGGQVAIAFDSRQDTVHSTDSFGSLGSSLPQSQTILYSIMPQNSGKDYKAREVPVAQPVMAAGPGGGNQGGDYLVDSHTLSVRRLMPVECEKLQGLPPGWTDVPYRKRNYTPDGPRYKAIGNGMAVPVVRWILRRLDLHLKGLL
jgi:DNA (cytosine-5)-methyltransferase 1